MMQLGFPIKYYPTISNLFEIYIVNYKVKVPKIQIVKSGGSL